MDVVYIVGVQNSHEELRYSLRSLANLEHGRVWIAGHLPAWVRNVGHIATLQTGTVWQNSTNNLLAACSHPEVSDRFIFMNDDYFILQPTEIGVFHRGPIIDRYPRCGQTVKGQRKYDGMEGTYNLCREAGVETPLDYELHVPLPVVKQGMAEAVSHARRADLNVDRLRKRSLYGNLNAIGGNRIKDVTSRDRGSTWEDGQLFVSTSNVSFADWPVGDRLRELFPEPSIYEKRMAA